MSTEGMRGLWAAVLWMAIREYRVRVDAARKGKRSASIDGSRMQLMSVDAEIRFAREYFSGPDAAHIAEMAGFTINVPKVMAEVTRERGRSVYARANRDYSQMSSVVEARKAREQITPTVIKLHRKQIPMRHIAFKLGVGDGIVQRIIREAGA